MDRLTALVPPRLRSGWTLVALIALIVLAAWLPDLGLAFGDSDDGRILGRFGLQARNFWDDGAAASGFGASMEPYGAGNYAHHPPLQNFIHIGAVGIFGEGVVAHRLVGFLIGAATVVVMAALLRTRGIGWGPTLLATGAMASTGFYFVYMRQGGGFSVLLLAIASTLYLAEQDEPARWMLSAGAIIAALAALHSWISVAVMGLLVLWLLATRRLAPVTIWVGAGALFGLLLTAAWVFNATDAGDLTGQLETRTDTAQFTLGEFLSRQWTFARRLTPVWFQWLIAPALIAGIIDRRTRMATALTLGTAAAWTFLFQEGAWVHVLWNLPWLAPIAIGLGALFDNVRRRMVDQWAVGVGLVMAVVMLVTLWGVFDGRVRNQNLIVPARAGELLELYEPLPETRFMWAAPGVSTARWAAYYWDVPVRTLQARNLAEVGGDDFVLVNVNRVPAHLPENIADLAVDQIGRYALVRGDALPQP